MTQQRTLVRSAHARVGLALCLASMGTRLTVARWASAQEGQGKYITQATVRLIKLVNVWRQFEHRFVASLLLLSEHLLLGI